MSHFLYILYSKAVNRFYVGETPDPNVRLEQHNTHHFKRNFTKAAEDWEIALSKKCASRADAIYLERFIKRMESKKFIRKVIENPKMSNDILYL